MCLLRPCDSGLKSISVSYEIFVIWGVTLCFHQQTPTEVWHWATRPVAWEWPCDPSYITGTLLHPQTHTSRKWSLSQGQHWKAERLRKRLAASIDCRGEKTPPTIPLCSDNKPVVARRTQTKTTLSFSSCSPCSLYLYPSFDFLCGRPAGISNPKTPEPLPLSLLPSIPPSSDPLLPVLPA